MAKAKTENKEVAMFGDKAALPAYVTQDAALGHENVSAEDMAIPQIKLLQNISPEVEEIEGARAGQFLNSMTQELYDELFLVNLKFDRTYTVWKDRGLGGGKEGEFDSEEAAKSFVSTLPGSAEDYAINETAIHYVLIVDPETMKVTSPAIMYMDRSKLSASRAWNSQINMKSNGEAPRFASVWGIRPKKVTNKRNEHYYNIDIQFEGWVPDTLYPEVRKTFEGLTQQAA